MKYTSESKRVIVAAKSMILKQHDPWHYVIFLYEHLIVELNTVSTDMDATVLATYSSSNPKQYKNSILMNF